MSITDRQFETIFRILATSDRSVKSICKELKISFSSVFYRLSRDTSLQSRLEVARRSQADYIVQSMMDRLKKMNLEIRAEVDPKRINGIVCAANLWQSTIKWIACKYRPNLYGDKLAVDHNVEQLSNKFKSLFTPSTTVEVAGRTLSMPVSAPILSIPAPDDTHEVTVTDQHTCDQVSIGSAPVPKAKRKYMRKVRAVAQVPEQGEDIEQKKEGNE